MSFFDNFNSGGFGSSGGGLAAGPGKKKRRPQTTTDWQSFVDGLSRPERDQLYPGMHKDLIPAYEMITGGDANYGAEAGTANSLAGNLSGREVGSFDNLRAGGNNGNDPFSSSSTSLDGKVDERVSVASSEFSDQQSRYKSVDFVDFGTGVDTHGVNRHGLDDGGPGSFGEFRGPYRIWGGAHTYGDNAHNPVSVRYSYIDEDGNKQEDETIRGFSVEFNFRSGKSPETGTSRIQDLPEHNPRYLISTGSGTSNVQIVWYYKRLPVSEW